jgi:hypothetical protein
MSASAANARPATRAINARDVAGRRIARHMAAIIAWQFLVEDHTLAA